MDCQRCGRTVEPGASYCDQCGSRVGYTGATVRLAPEPLSRIAPHPVLTEIRKGMEVQFADGPTLGRVGEIWPGVDPPIRAEPCDEEICSRVEVRYGLAGREVWYIPYHGIAGVSGTTVVLNVDAATLNATGWRNKPPWIPANKHFLRSFFDHDPQLPPYGI